MWLSILIRHKKTLIIALAVIVVGLFAWYYFRKKEITQGDVPSDNPNDLPTESESEKANELARALYTNMNGVNNPYIRDMQVYKNLMQQSDKVFTLTYNRFNTLYQMAGKGTLRDWLHDDWFAPTDWEYITDIIFPRMDRLNLD